MLLASGADLQSPNPLVTTHPLAKQVQRYVLLTTLVRYDSTLTLRPYLARSWEWSTSRTRLTFHLVRGVRWHDGAPTTAQDVEFTLQTAQDPATGYPRTSDLEELVRVDAIDDSTVILDFSGPQRGIPDVFSDLAIVPVHLLGAIAHGDLRRAPWNQAPIGNGPFRFVSHEPNRRWVFERNDDFADALGGPPLLQRLVVAIVDEPTTKLAALTSGELDFAGIQPGHASFVRRHPQLEVLDYPLLFTVSLIFNTRRPPFDDRRRREAIMLALDRPEIVNGIAFGFGTPASGPVPTELLPELPEPTPFLPDSARALLAGESLEFELLTVGSGEVALEQLVQAQLAKVGVIVRIRQMELSAFLDRIYAVRPDFDAAILGVPGDLDLGYLAPLLEVTGQVAGDDPLDQFRRDVPATFLYHARGVQGKRRQVQGVQMDLRGELPTVTSWHIVP